MKNLIKKIFVGAVSGFVVLILLSVIFGNDDNNGVEKENVNIKSLEKVQEVEEVQDVAGVEKIEEIEEVKDVAEVEKVEDVAGVEKVQDVAGVEKVQDEKVNDKKIALEILQSYVEIEKPFLEKVSELSVVLGNEDFVRAGILTIECIELAGDVKNEYFYGVEPDELIKDKELAFLVEEVGDTLGSAYKIKEDALKLLSTGDFEGMVNTNNRSQYLLSDAVSQIEEIEKKYNIDVKF